MLSVFRKFVGFKLLEYFLRYPTNETYLNELAKKLHISSRSAKIYCDLFDKEGIINREIKGNIHLFTTNNDNYQVREMKRAYIINLLAELDIDLIADDGVSVAVYGSYATGDYDEKSDIDIVIIGEEHQIKRDRILDIMKRLGKEIQLTIIPIVKWEKMKRNHDAFTQNMLRNHVLIKGVDL